MSVTGTAIRLGPRPPLKWAGGKGRLLTQLAPLFPPSFGTYHEPFLGGGAVFFYLRPARALLGDNNAELVNFYRVVRDDLAVLLGSLCAHQNEERYYYGVRGMNPADLSPVERASRFLYLNKTGYNGLWRVNRRGGNNVPFGRYKNPRFGDGENLRLVSAALRQAELFCGDFTRVLGRAASDDFVYLDPPYHPLSPTANFTGYTPDAFRSEDQERLAVVFRELDRRGCRVCLSNSDTPFIRGLYPGYDTRTVVARRAINCRADGRGPVNELVIRNYG